MSNALATAAIASAMTEAQLLDNVIDAAQKLGWRVAHFRPATMSQGWRTAVSGDGKGFPDLVMVNERMGELLFVELKSERGKTSPEQGDWLRALTSLKRFDGHVRTFVWLPSNWLSGAIQRVLEGVE